MPHRSKWPDSLLRIGEGRAGQAPAIRMSGTGDRTGTGADKSGRRLPLGRSGSIRSGSAEGPLLR
jgi:hypothetical protein